MTFPWLFGLGFGIVFSALFAKIYRVREVLASATEFRRKRVQAKDVFYIIVFVLSVEFVLVLVWHLVDPLIWDRELIRATEDGLPLQSIGQCTSEQGLIFWLIFIAFNVCLLLYALVLCYKTWDYPSAFAESRWITACVISYIQILLLAVPILVIVTGDNNIFFFVKATIVFLMSMSVTLFIFLPKLNVLHGSQGGQTGTSIARATHEFVRARNQTNSNDDPSVFISGLAPPSSDNFDATGSFRSNRVEPLATSEIVDRATYAISSPAKAAAQSVVEEISDQIWSSDEANSSTADATDVEKGT